MPRFDASGLITAVVTDVRDGELLMVAHMNEEALRLTLETELRITGPARGARFGRRARRRAICKAWSSCGRTAIRMRFGSKYVSLVMDQLAIRAAVPVFIGRFSPKMAIYCWPLKAPAITSINLGQKDVMARIRVAPSIRSIYSLDTMFR